MKREIPDEWYCSITYEIFEDPIYLELDGHPYFYEREAFKNWIKTCKTNGTTPTNPLTGIELPKNFETMIKDAINLKKEIENYNNGITEQPNFLDKGPIKVSEKPTKETNYETALRIAFHQLEFKRKNLSDWKSELSIDPIKDLVNEKDFLISIATAVKNGNKTSESNLEKKHSFKRCFNQALKEICKAQKKAGIDPKCKRALSTITTLLVWLARECDIKVVTSLGRYKPRANDYKRLYTTTGISFIDIQKFARNFVGNCVDLSENQIYISSPWPDELFISVPLDVSHLISTLIKHAESEQFYKDAPEESLETIEKDDLFQPLRKFYQKFKSSPSPSSLAVHEEKPTPYEEGQGLLGVSIAIRHIRCAVDCLRNPEEGLKFFPNASKKEIKEFLGRYMKQLTKALQDNGGQVSIADKAVRDIVLSLLDKAVKNPEETLPNFIRELTGVFYPEYIYKLKFRGIERLVENILKFDLFSDFPTVVNAEKGRYLGVSDKLSKVDSGVADNHSILLSYKSDFEAFTKVAEGTQNSQLSKAKRNCVYCFKGDMNRLVMVMTLFTQGKLEALSKFITCIVDKETGEPIFYPADYLKVKSQKSKHPCEEKLMGALDELSRIKEYRPFTKKAFLLLFLIEELREAPGFEKLVFQKSIFKIIGGLGLLEKTHQKGGGFTEGAAQELRENCKKLKALSKRQNQKIQSFFIGKEFYMKVFKNFFASVEKKIQIIEKVFESKAEEQSQSFTGGLSAMSGGGSEAAFSTHWTQKKPILLNTGKFEGEVNGDNTFSEDESSDGIFLSELKEKEPSAPPVQNNEDDELSMPYSNNRRILINDVDENTPLLEDRARAPSFLSTSCSFVSSFFCPIKEPEDSEGSEDDNGLEIEMRYL